MATQQVNRAHDRERELRQHQQRRDGWLEANAHLGLAYRQVVRALAWQRRATGLWFSLKAVELANRTGRTLAEVIDQAHRGIDRIRRTPHLAYSFLRHTGLSVA